MIKLENFSTPAIENKNVIFSIIFKYSTGSLIIDQIQTSYEIHFTEKNKSQY